MKLKENDIKITETYALKTGKSHAEKVEIFKMEFILYFEALADDTEYKVYRISEKTYKKALTGYKIEDQNKEYVGSMPLEEDEQRYIMNLQNKYKIFGKFERKKGGKALTVISCIVLVGVVMMLFGGFKIFNNKQVLARKQVVQGEVTNISTNRLMGKRYAEGYYDVHVKYSVNGKTYEGYNGTTANQLRIGEKMNVCFDSKHPERIIVMEDMKQYSFLFVYIGAIVAVVGTTLLISEIRFRKYK